MDTTNYQRLHRYLAARFTPGQEFGLHLTVGIVLMLAAAWIFGIIASDVVDKAEITVLDLRLANWFHLQTDSGWTPFMHFITNWHHPAGVLLMTLMVGAWFRARQAPFWMVTLALSVPGGMVLNVLLKYTFQRARPSFDEPLVMLATYSFPSGHTSGATVFYGVLAAYVVCTSKRPLVKGLAIAAAVFMIALVALTRIYLGAHYLSDVLAGVAVGAAWLAVCITSMSTLRRRRAARANE